MVSTEILDILAATGLAMPDISILSDEFLAEVSQMEKKNLALPAGRRGADGFGPGGGTVGTMGGLSVMGELAERTLAADRVLVC